MVRPGSNYKLYRVFLEASAILADLAGLELKSDTALEKQEDIIAQLHRARKIRAVRGSDSLPASRDISEYVGLKEDPSIRQMHSILRGFFETAKKGDLVLVPPSSFSQDALIGELIGDPTEIIEAEVNGERLFGRKVAWLGKVAKGKLSVYLLDLIAKPNAFVQLRRAETPPILRAAYGSYVLPGKESEATECRARFDVDDPDFTTTDDLYIQAFFNFVAANSRRIRGKDGHLSDIKHAAFEILTGADAFDLQSNINSPGFLNLSSKGYGALVAAALFAIAVNIGPDAVEAAEKGTVLVGNSLDANDPCTVAVHEEVLQHLRLLGVDKWAEACLIARHAAGSTGLTGQAKVVVEEDNPTSDER